MRLSVKRFDLKYPCHADFGAMREARGGRFCDDCQTVVHDLSAMDEREARALLDRTPSDRVCVRYVYDAQSGDMVFGASARDRSRIVPEHRLLARLKSKVALAAAFAAPLLVEACGGNDGNYTDRPGEPGSGQFDELPDDPGVDGSAGAAGAAGAAGSSGDVDGG